MKTKAAVLLVAAVFGLCGYLFLESRAKAARQAAKEVAKRAAIEAQEKAALREMVSRYSASTDWLASLPAPDEEPLFTLDLSKALVRSGGPPVLMEMDLQDLTEKEGVFTAHFTESEFDNHLFKVHAALRCSSQQAGELMKARTRERSGMLRYATVVRVEQVSRPAFKLAVGEEGDALVEIETSNLFCLKGTCVDFVPLESEVEIWSLWASGK